MKSHLRRASTCALALISILALSACSSESDAAPDAAAASPSDSHESGEATAAPSNRIDIPSVVRTNLGITFARVERRALEQRLSVPGSFELPPEATHHYTSPFAGHVKLAEGLSEYGPVQAGQLLYTLDVPLFAEVRAELEAKLSDTEVALLDQPLLEAEVRYAQAATAPELFDGRRAAIDRLEAPMLAHVQSLEDSMAVWRERTEELEALKSRGAALGNELAEARASIAALEIELADAREDHAKLALDRAAIDAEELAASREVPLARARLQALQNKVELADRELGKALLAAAAKLRMSPDELSATDEQGVQAWRRLQPIAVRARRSGIVAGLPVRDGGWVEQGVHLLEIMEPNKLRFRAHVRQLDLPFVSRYLSLNSLSFAREDRISLQAALRVPGGDASETVPCELRAVPSGDPEARTFDLLAYPNQLPRWAQVGVRTQLELMVPSMGDSLVIPRDAVIRDGLKDIVFRRDPWDDDKAVRIEPLFGRVDGDWIEILTEVAEGDEVVLGGVYELKLASGTSEQPKGGHFHADGTWHEGEH